MGIFAWVVFGIIVLLTLGFLATMLILLVDTDNDPGDESLWHELENLRDDEAGN